MTNSKSIYDISIIIPTYNRGELLTYTLDSLVNQTMDKSKFEVIVSDDGSSDNTKEIVGGYDSSLNLKYLFQEDRGFRVPPHEIMEFVSPKEKYVYL